MARNFDDLSAAPLYLKMLFSGTGAIMATCTGFVYDFEGIQYLITNGHNVTRINPFDNSRLSDHCGFPDIISTNILVKNAEGTYMARSKEGVRIDLYEDQDCLSPLWYVHPTLGYKVDVVAIPICSNDELKDHIVLKAINKYKWETRFPTQVSDDAFILGYPLDIVNPLHLPIWKRATIASEPEYNLDELPYMLVDTATRSGMSGSPVIMQRNGLHILNEAFADGSFWGVIRNFIGIYSGRIGNGDNYMAQLGIVWKSQVIEEILCSKVKGDNLFQKI